MVRLIISLSVLLLLGCASGISKEESDNTCAQVMDSFEKQISLCKTQDDLKRCGNLQLMSALCVQNATDNKTDRERLLLLTKKLKQLENSIN